MKVFILTKKSFLVSAVCALMVALTLVMGFYGANAAIQTATSNKELPIYYTDKQEKVISISFDAAWGNEQTSQLLKILNDYNVKTTFFVVGSWVDKYPESVKEIQDAGHEVCNHSNTHAHLASLSHDKIVDEIESCNKKIEAITGKSPDLFRPPYGEYNNEVIKSAKELNMYTIQWNVDSLDWKDPTPQQMKERILKKIEPGAIVLLHNGAKNTPAALSETIAAIQAEGYKIVPISELIHKGSYKIEHDGKQIPTDQS